MSGFFSKHAKAYSVSVSHASGSDLDELINSLKVGSDDRAIDVATGTGFTAFRLAKEAGFVIGLDLTREMTDQAIRLQSEEGSAAVQFVIGNSELLPFADGCSTIVTCRRAAHHFGSKDRFLAESLRILAAGGRIGISDMLAPEGFKDEYNALERIRDPTHETAEDSESWKLLLEDAGFRVERAVVMEEKISLEKWVYPLALNSPEGVACGLYLSEAKSDFRAALGLNDDFSFTKRRIVLIGRK